MRHDPIGVAHQHLQQRQLLARELMALAANQRGSFGEIEHHIPARKRAKTVSPGGAAQMGADARQQFAHAEGLADIVVGAGVERFDFFRLAAASGNDDDGSHRGFAHGANHLLAVDVGKGQFKQHQIRLLREDQVDGLQAGIDLNDIETCVDELLPQNAMRIGLVVDNENAGLHFCGSSLGPMPWRQRA